MSSTYRIERDRGTKELRQQLAVLREKWPLAFPIKDHEVRPLAIEAYLGRERPTSFASNRARRGADLSALCKFGMSFSSMISGNSNFFFDDTSSPMKRETPLGSLCLFCHAVFFC